MEFSFIGLHWLFRFIYIHDHGCTQVNQFTIYFSGQRTKKIIYIHNVFGWPLIVLFALRIDVILDLLGKLTGAAVQQLLRDSSVPQSVGFLACLCKAGLADPEEYVLILYCFPTHMRSEVKRNIDYDVKLQGEATSNRDLNKDDEAFFTLSEELIPSGKTDTKNTSLR